MRAKEFIIKVNVKLNGTDEPEVSVSNPELVDDDEEQFISNFIPPLQQQIEMMKSAAGKESNLLSQITAGDEDNSDF
jgi:hypothetical protein